jgi:GxxExxY protein
MGDHHESADPQTYTLIGAAMAVHRALGNGFLEVVYQEAFAIELESRGIPFQKECSFDIRYRGRLLQSKYRADFVCHRSVVVELKALGRLGRAEEAQLINYLKASGIRRGILFNFGALSLEYRRFLFDQPQPVQSVSSV